MKSYIPISHLASACNCPICGAYAQQTWLTALLTSLGNQSGYTNLNSYAFSQCNHCQKYTIWFDGKLIHPLNGTAPLPNSDLPEDIKADYEEARSIVELSPRGAVALLRLCVQKLCKALGEKGENINQDIKQLVANGLPIRMQQALDSVRVIGNNAVHPGQIDLKDDRETAYKLFGFINIIGEVLITQPQQIEQFYNIQLPQGDKEAIARRDGTIC